MNEDESPIGPELGNDSKIYDFIFDINLKSY